MTPSHDSRHASAPPSRAARVGWTLLGLMLLATLLVLRPKIEAWFAVPESDPVSPAWVDAADAQPASKTSAAAVKSQPASPRKTEPPDDGKADRGKTEPAAAAKFAGLKDIGRNVKLSPAGLRYAPGSEEGHRLKHVLRHDNDQPDRPGSHGVFDGDENDALAAIDEAYLVAKAGGSRVKRRDEADRTVVEVDMQRRIGFLGGQEGKRRGHPPVRRLRLVLEGNNVITAFPF